MSDRELRLQPRLQRIADCVPQGTRLADVGTDHGYLPVWLIQNKRISHAIASDINAAPLEHARRTAELYGVDDEQLELRLCAGLEGYAPNEADTIVIAGMGGETIAAILDAVFWLRGGDTVLLLQPMTKVELLRRHITENGFRIISERLVLDKGVIYTVIEAISGTGQKLSGAEAWCGVGLENDPLYGEYVSSRIRKLEDAAAGIRRGKNANLPVAEALESNAAELRIKLREWENADRK
ncbi:MAG: SAM-dependent methyltransferase [Oscillospiraceae bacterium]|nr:SAM-dependent methyltransferase [Oscillospiraceae bacterium]